MVSVVGNEAIVEFTESLKKNKEFQKVYRGGRSCANRILVMYVLPVSEDANRIGISVSKKVGNSVVRHRLTRLIRESYRLQEHGFKKGYWIVVIARAAAKGQTFRKIENALLHLARTQRILENEKMDDQTD